MNRRPHLTLVALIVAGLIGVGLLAVPGSPIEQTPTLGLDLQGGLEVTLKAVPPPNRPLQKSDLEPLGRRFSATASTGSVSRSPRSASRVTTRS